MNRLESILQFAALMAGGDNRIRRLLQDGGRNSRFYVRDVPVEVRVAAVQFEAPS